MRWQCTNLCVWAKDQQKNKQKTSYIKQDRKNRRQRLESAESTNQINKKVSVAMGVSVPIHTNRTQFKHCDLLVPWKLKKNELEDVCRKLTNIEIVQSYYDQGNWCVVIKKIKE
ncbi:hypothetical protein NQ317_008183 [Molorchus minor]|uniref:Uncharacterized protein n=1 Tax=Molorchus minor TaxID=1323400 RepID=A0ABQ9JK78_9CUCU|nr:hypothetical protein NQ317_008183 [Molorchus minor]